MGVILAAAPAWACRGTAELSAVQVQLAMADIPGAERDMYLERLNAGIALHQRGHEADSMELRLKSLEILDEIKVKLGM
jgi:hypothetical protein